jgi:hypothetical protein
MTTKTCTKCGIDKELSQFSSDKNKKDGKYPSCKECKSGADKKYRESHLEEKHTKDKKYYKENSTKIKERSSKWYNDNKEYQLERMKKYYKENYTKIKETQKKWDELNKDKIKEYFKFKYNNDINYRIRQVLSQRLRLSIKSKKEHTLVYLDCDIEFFKNWIEYQFDDSMNWDNIGTWHFDHVIPCASFDLTIEEQIFKCFNWSNIRPLNSSENYSKGSKIIITVIDKHKSVVKNYLQLYDVPRDIGNSILAEK